METPTSDASTAVDPRAELTRSLDQTQTLVNALQPRDAERATPCGDYDVQTLVAHLVGVLRKIASVGRGEGFSRIADPATDVGDDFAVAFSQARSELEAAWSGHDALATQHTLPWAVMSGREVLAAYTHEFTVHAWDLARVLGAENALDPGLARSALAWYRVNVPADQRDPRGPFGPVIEVPETASVYDRLAGFVGREVA